MGLNLILPCNKLKSKKKWLPKITTSSTVCHVSSSVLLQSILNKFIFYTKLQITLDKVSKVNRWCLLEPARCTIAHVSGIDRTICICCSSLSIRGDIYTTINMLSCLRHVSSRSIFILNWFRIYWGHLPGFTQHCVRREGYPADPIALC